MFGASLLPDVPVCNSARFEITYIHTKAFAWICQNTSFFLRPVAESKTSFDPAFLQA